MPQVTSARNPLKKPVRPVAASPSDLCLAKVVHDSEVARARERALPPSTVDSLAALFKVLADPTRIRILSALAATELCVCDLEAVLGMSQSATSHQLALLRSARLVRSRREGKVIFYRLDDDHVRMLLDLGLEHRNEAEA
ncbi:MAG: metalloregulator ArsR/SmtB family transcription factor [Spirochaetota bacterium]